MKIKPVEHTLTVEQLEESGLPRAFWHFQADTYVGSREALECVLNYLRKFDNARNRSLGLFIRGETETQKTFLASYVIRALLLRGLDAAYVSMPDLVDQILSRNLDLKAFLTKPDLLVIDNVNKPGNSFWATAVERCLMHRKDDGKPTIIVTQLMKKGGVDEFAQQYGETSLRLIEHLSVTVWAECDETQKLRAENQRKAILAEEV